jgi:hypothetical protein
MTMVCSSTSRSWRRGSNRVGRRSTGCYEGYSASTSNLSGVTLANDNVFGDNTSAQMAQMTAAVSGSVSAGYTATLLVGVPA